MSAALQRLADSLAAPAAKPPDAPAHAAVLQGTPTGCERCPDAAIVIAVERRALPPCGTRLVVALCRPCLVAWMAEHGPGYANYRWLDRTPGEHA